MVTFHVLVFVMRCMGRREGGELKEILGGGMIMNEENDLDHKVEGDAVEGPVVCVGIEEVPPMTSRSIIVVGCC